MLNIYTFSTFGFDGAIITVEVDLRRGIPATDIVGIVDAQVKDSRERIKAAICNSGLEYPSERILISLSPADIRKDDAIFELPIALGVLQKQFKDKVLVMGGLDLSGNIRHVRGVYAACATALANGIQYAIVPSANLNEALETGIKAIGCDTLADAFNLPDDLSTKKFADKIGYDNTITFRYKSKPNAEPNVKMTDKEMLALVVGASGGFNMLFFGSPGCGKTVLLQYMYYLLPSLTEEEANSVKRIWSLAGLRSTKDDGKVVFPPFRMPHQTATIEGMCGGGPNCRPGEISLAHNGVLFLDEAAEFRSSVLQMLRVPLESRSITLSRAGRCTIYPADFQLLMTCNPCPCGYYGSKDKICLCSARSIELYMKKFSGPLLDRMQIRLHIDPSDGERETHSLEELQTYVRRATEKSRKFGVKLRNLPVPEIEKLVPIFIYERINKLAEQNGWSERRRYNMCKIWITIMFAFGDDDTKYDDYLNKAEMLMGSFEFK